jgi:tetratricopeptide (TPR) repeat protein
MYDAGDYSAVIRYRDAFSRMLWIEGHLEQRLKLGDITEDAAIKLGNLKAQIASLIDDLGWTSVALGRYEKAVGFLKHGLRLAEAANEYYWSAKAHRHLGGLYVEKRDYPRAYEHLTAAMEEALKVPIEPERNEMVAGIEYGLAITAYSGADYEVALKHLETSNRLRRDLGDESRTVRIYAMIGKIYEAKNDLSQAKDNFRKGIREAKRVGRVDEEIRNLLGLARVLAEEYRLDGTQLPKKEESDRCQAQAAELMQLTPIPLELSLNEVTHRRAITREGKQHG